MPLSSFYCFITGFFCLPGAFILKRHPCGVAGAPPTGPRWTRPLPFLFFSPRGRHGDRARARASARQLVEPSVSAQRESKIPKSRARTRGERSASERSRKHTHVLPVFDAPTVSSPGVVSGPETRVNVSDVNGRRRSCSPSRWWVLCCCLCFFFKRLITRRPPRSLSLSSSLSLSLSLYLLFRVFFVTRLRTITKNVAHGRWQHLTTHGGEFASCQKNVLLAKCVVGANRDTGLEYVNYPRYVQLHKRRWPSWTKVLTITL